MEINKDLLKCFLTEGDITLIYSDQAKLAFNMDPDEFEKGVQEYIKDYKKWGLPKQNDLFQIKFSILSSEVTEFHQELDDIVQLQKAVKDNPEGLGETEVKAIVEKSKEIYVGGINTLAPWAALLYMATQTENKA